jgi:hypothetical protein
MRAFRFSFNMFGLTTARAFAELCREGERLGYDSVLAADHLGLPAPFPLLVAAAQATERMRVGTLVLNAGFWNPALLAREIATADILTDGRLEIGLGSGHMKSEFDAASRARPRFPTSHRERSGWRAPRRRTSGCPSPAPAPANGPARSSGTCRSSVIISDDRQAATAKLVAERESAAARKGIDAGTPCLPSPRRWRRRTC